MQMMFAQSDYDDVRMPHEGNLGVKLHDYAKYDRGFFCAGEFSGAYSPSASEKSLTFTELDFVGGYRFNEYIRTGLGLGARWYINPGNYRAMNHDWGMALFVNARGNMIPNEYHDVVPFWSVDFGGVFPDGVMFRPAVGIRVGQQRSAFIVSLGYVLQQIRTYKNPSEGNFDIDHKARSFMTLKLGYEF